MQALKVTLVSTMTNGGEYQSREFLLFVCTDDKYSDTSLILMFYHLIVTTYPVRCMRLGTTSAMITPTKELKNMVTRVALWASPTIKMKGQLW
jgi:hypothetical protein